MPLNDATKLGLANRFSVTIDFAAYDLGSWAQVDGLTVKWSVAEYRAAACTRSGSASRTASTPNRWP